MHAWCAWYCVGVGWRRSVRAPGLHRACEQAMWRGMRGHGHGSEPVWCGRPASHRRSSAGAGAGALALPPPLRRCPSRTGASAMGQAASARGRMLAVCVRQRGLWLAGYTGQAGSFICSSHPTPRMRATGTSCTRHPRRMGAAHSRRPRERRELLIAGQPLLLLLLLAARPLTPRSTSTWPSMVGGRFSLVGWCECECTAL